jgi:hypothetical protein
LAIDAGELAASIFQGVHFAVQDSAVFLDATVVAATDNLAVVHNYGADRDTPFSQSGLGFVDGSLEKWIHGKRSAH